MLKYLYMVIICLIFSKSLTAQLKWQPKGILHTDKNITVEIEYSISPNPCGGENDQSYYRYKITKISKVRNYYLNSAFRARASWHRFEQ